jgi:hypothetical protein
MAIAKNALLCAIQEMQGALVSIYTLVNNCVIGKLMKGEQEKVKIGFPIYLTSW